MSDTKESTKFQWAGENERKLMMLTLGREMKAKDYEQVAALFPEVTLTAVKIRTSRLRVERTKLFEDLGLGSPDGGAAKLKTGSVAPTTASPKKGGKRKAKALDPAEATGVFNDVDVKKALSENEEDEMRDNINVTPKGKKLKLGGAGVNGGSGPSMKGGRQSPARAVAKVEQAIKQEEELEMEVAREVDDADSEDEEEISDNVYAAPRARKDSAYGGSDNGY